jgi:hypothetical protein
MPTAVWTDPKKYFSVHVLTLKDEPPPPRPRPDLATVG